MPNSLPQELLTKAHDWLAGLPRIFEIQYATLTVHRAQLTVLHGIYYERENEHSPTSPMVRGGHVQAGAKYREPWIYILGLAPKWKKIGTSRAPLLRIGDDDWYSASYYQRRPDSFPPEREAEYHPCGYNWLLHPWQHKHLISERWPEGERIDSWDIAMGKAPYRRFRTQLILAQEVPDIP